MIYNIVFNITQWVCVLNLILFLFSLAGRPTEFGEKHVYVCESQYKEAEQCMRKIKGLKLHKVANKVTLFLIYWVELVY